MTIKVNRINLLINVSILSIILSFQHQTMAKQEIDNFNAINLKIEKCASYREEFIENQSHHPQMTIETRKGLVEKGYNILKKIRSGKSIEMIENIIEFFPNGGRNFSTGFFTSQAFVPNIPTTKSCCNIFSSFYTAITTRDPSKIWEERPSKEIERTHKRQGALESLISVVWALADHAAEIGQPFNSGSFSIIDPQENLFKFFMNYILFLEEFSGLLNELPIGSYNAYSPYGNLFMYNRKPDTYSSSHYRETTIEQFGIDARFESTGWALPVLPYQGTHILVGRVKNNLGHEKTFIKFEAYGTGDLSSWALHGFELIQSFSHRGGKRSEKDIPREIVQDFIKLAVSIQDIDLPISQNIETDTDLYIIADMINQKGDLIDEGKLRKYDISSLSRFAYYLEEHMEIMEVKDYAYKFIMNLENTYKDGIFNPMIDNSAFAKVFYRTGNEVVFLIEELNRLNFEKGIS